MVPAKLQCKMCNATHKFLVYADEDNVNRWETNFEDECYRKHVHNSEQNAKYTKAMVDLIRKGLEIMKDEYEKQLKQVSFLTLKYRRAGN